MTDAKAENPNSTLPVDTEKTLAEPERSEAAVVLKNLVILPPLQQKGTLDRDEMLDRVSLPPIRPEEPVSSIRAALAEVCGYSHLTNYRFELEGPINATETAGGNVNIVSPYTGRNAVVSVPSALKHLGDEEKVENGSTSLVLDEYGDLSFLLEKGLQDGSAFRIVLERYDVGQVRDHISRLRSLLDGNAPSLTTLDESGGKPEPSNGSTGSDESTKEEASAEKQEKEKLPAISTGKATTLDGSALKDYYYHVCGEDPSLYLDTPVKSNLSKRENGSKTSKKKGKNGSNRNQKGEESSEQPTEEQLVRDLIPRLNRLEEESRVACKIQLGGFHPPPRSRRLMGDLAYLEVTPPGESEPIHITAIPTGFYLNRSKSNKFDPSPAANPCFSHELLDCLCQASESFVVAWTRALSASKARTKLMEKLNKDGHFSSLFRIAIRGDFEGYTNPSSGSAAEGIDALIQNPSWIVSISKYEEESNESWNRNSTHSHNPANTEDDIGNAFGVDMRNGTPRDWNEELQTAREMPDTSLPERIERAR